MMRMKPFPNRGKRIRARQINRVFLYGGAIHVFRRPPFLNALWLKYPFGYPLGCPLRYPTECPTGDPRGLNPSGFNPNGFGLADAEKVRVAGNMDAVTAPNSPAFNEVGIPANRYA